MRYKTKLTIMDSTKAASGTSLTTGCSVPESGIYRASHPQHKLPAEVTLLRNQTFPRCSRCDQPVFFELVRSAPALVNVHPSAFTVALYELPELSTDEEAAS
ncbi:MAG TPA: hypothetical protein VJT08_00595 [Terriglobales bacterium]|nr:hypothetical protein [Terriglobales bacterium]